MIPRIYNSASLALTEVPRMAVEVFRETIFREIGQGSRLVALFADGREGGIRRLFAVLGNGASGLLGIFSTEVTNTYPALTPECPQAHWFERELAEQWGIQPIGHPWLKPIRYQPAATRSRKKGGDRERHSIPGETRYFSMAGDEIHEVAVGPVHAGIIEPGHFRFQCHGETVHHLEISLGYQHRGIECAMVGGPDKRSIHYMETLAGDTTVGHATAYCQALEALAGGGVSARGQALRGIALELERMANHTGDLGAMANDIAFLPTASFCGRLRGDILNMTAVICGNRFGRGLVRSGGTGYDVEPDRIADLRRRLCMTIRDVREAAELLWNTPSVRARFEETGRLEARDCETLGLVGVAARAAGLGRDVRNEYPYGIYRLAHVPVSTWQEGDVFGRAYVRWLEIQRSAQFINDLLAALPEGAIREPVPELAPDRIAVSLVEGWRGEIVHVALTDARGRFARYKVIDPSFHNWFGLALAMRGQPISDFPLCNKSFNLSYCGHDL